MPLLLSAYVCNMLQYIYYIDALSLRIASTISICLGFCIYFIDPTYKLVSLVKFKHHNPLIKVNMCWIKVSLSNNSNVCMCKLCCNIGGKCVIKKSIAFLSMLCYERDSSSHDGKLIFFVNFTSSAWTNKYIEALVGTWPNSRQNVVLQCNTIQRRIFV